MTNSKSLFDHVSKVARYGDRNRFLCAQFAPGGKRGPLCAVLAFNQEVGRIPEIVTEQAMAQMRLVWWRDAIANAYAHTPNNHPVVQAITPVIHDYGLPQDWFETYLEARCLDVGGESASSLDALESYAENTSGMVHRMQVRILLECDDPRTEEVAQAVGCAWGLIGLVRAVPYHHAHGRFFLPGLRPNQNDADRTNAIESVVARAQARLNAVRSLSSGVNKKALPALLVGRLVDGYAKRLRQAGFDPSVLPVDESRAGHVVRMMLGKIRGRY